jgi:hypothetical protein
VKARVLQLDRGADPREARADDRDIDGRSRRLDRGGAGTGPSRHLLPTHESAHRREQQGQGFFVNARLPKNLGRVR